MARVTSLSAGLGPTAKVDLNSGAFTIVRDGNEEIWLSSDGKGVFLRHHGARYGVDDGSLLLVNGSIWKGRDAWGTFKEFTLTYEADPGDGSNVLQMVATIRQSRRAVTFEQVFFRMPGLENCSAGDADGLATAFPVFDLPEAGGGGAGMPTSQCAWTSWDYTAKGADGVSLEAPGFASPTCRAWDAAHAASFPAGLAGTGPMILWPESAAHASSSSNAMVLSPMLNVMALNLAVLPAAATGAATSRVAFGVMGAVSAVPAGFAARVVAFFGTEGAGINGAMAEWGAAMRWWTGKAHAGANRLSDITLKYLGYSTDNGAYYYYHTDDGGEGKKKRKLRSSAQISYQETLVNVRQRHQVEQGIPYAYALLDSWWYEHGPAYDGTVNWTDAVAPAQTAYGNDLEVFPEGGMAGFYRQSGWLVQAHNRWWDPAVVYAAQNGGDYLFVVDEEHGGALPLSQAFWDDLLAGKASWGLRVYEQDWLGSEFADRVSALTRNASLARQWLRQMGAAAEKHGIAVQYCMPFARHLLASLEIPAVTQARASDDYKPSDRQWAIGGQAVLMDALGLAPSKDSFWSSAEQPGNPYEDTPFASEPFSELQAAVTSLSAGPVAPSDGVDYANASLIMRACRADGRLLQPSVPAKLIDRAFRYRAVAGGGQTSSATDLIDGEVWGAWSTVAGRSFGLIFAANLTHNATVTPSDFRSLDPRYATHFFSVESNQEKNSDVAAEAEKWVVVDVRAVLAQHAVEITTSNTPPKEAKTEEAILQNVVAQEFSAEAPLSLRACGRADFQLFAILPVEPNGWSLFGEVNKWVGVAAARFMEITSTPDAMLVEANGSPEEVLYVGFVRPDRAIVVGKCTFDESTHLKATPEGCFSRS